MAVYLIHTDEPLDGRQHYLGSVVESGNLDAALEAIGRRHARHAAGRGARFMDRVCTAGIGWRTARIWPHSGLREEMATKRAARAGYAAFCPVCRGGWDRIEHPPTLKGTKS